MTQEQYPQPNQPPIVPGEFTHGHEATYTKDDGGVREALKYIDEMEPNWVLEPTSITVEQPDNQEQLLDNLDQMLSTQEDGEKLSMLLEDNLRAIAEKADTDGPASMAKLHIKAGYNMNELATPDLTRSEYDMLRRGSPSREEYIEDVDQPNVMLTGLLVATGAEVIRDDLADGNGSGRRIYKGMFEGKPVYFEENLQPRIIEDESGKKTVMGRSVWALSERTARNALNTLSDTDRDVLESIGVDMPMINSSEYTSKTYPNRSRMVETLRLYAAMNPSVAEASDAGDVGQDMPPIEADPTEKLRVLQEERDQQEEAVISNFQAHGATEEQIQAYRDDITRMKQAELGRGRLFPHQAGFVRFEALNKPEEGLDMGVGTGFEQGDDVLVERTSGAVESGWIFLGIDPKTGMAEVARFEDETGNRLSKKLTIDELKKLNKKSK